MKRREKDYLYFRGVREQSDPELRMLRRVNVTRIRVRTGATYVPCADGRHFDEAYTHIRGVLQATGISVPEIHSSPRAGGGIIGHPNSPAVDREVRQDRGLYYEIVRGFILRGYTDVIMESHRDCGQARLAGLRLKDQYEWLMRSKAYFKAQCKHWKREGSIEEAIDACLNKAYMAEDEELHDLLVARRAQMRESYPEFKTLCLMRRLCFDDVPGYVPDIVYPDEQLAVEGEGSKIFAYVASYEAWEKDLKHRGAPDPHIEELAEWGATYPRFEGTRSMFTTDLKPVVNALALT